MVEYIEDIPRICRVRTVIEGQHNFMIVEYEGRRRWLARRSALGLFIDWDRQLS